jgi:hypothetical protein
MDVAAWLRGLGLGKYEKAFLANDIDAKVLVDLTGEDLVELGVTSIGHRRKLLAAALLLRDQTTVLPVQDPAVFSVSPVTFPRPRRGRRVRTRHSSNDGRCCERERGI